MLSAYLDTLKKLTNTADPGFEDVFDKITHPGKEKIQSLLVYVDRVLNFMLNRECQGIRCTQIHFPEMDDELKNLLLEFIAIRTFYRSLEFDKERDDYIEDRLATLSNRLNNHHLPDNAKALNGGNVAYKSWVSENKSWLQEVAFLRSIGDGRKSLWPDSILNILNGDLPILEESLYTMTLEDLDDRKRRAYSLLNVELSITELIKKLTDLGRLQSIRQIILFDCEGGRRTFGSYKQQALERFIQRGYAMKDLVILSFDKRPFRLWSVLNKLNIIYRNYFVPPERRSVLKDTYVLQNQEVGQLVTQKDDTIPIHWIGQESELFSDYVDLVIGYGIDKLRAVSSLNIYAGAMNMEMANRIVADLFGEDSKEWLFDLEVRTAINELDLPKRELLKTTVNRVLELVMLEWEGIKDEMRKYTRKGQVGMVVPLPLVNNTLFRRGLKALLPEARVNIHTWKDIRDDKCKEPIVFILAYRDVGRYPFIFYPSLLEGGKDRMLQYRPILLQMFFGKKYVSCVYQYHLILNELLGNAFRYTFLDWQAVDTWVHGMKPLQREELPEEVDDDDELNDATEAIKVDYVDEGHATFYPSQLLLIRVGEGNPLAVVRADDLPDNAEYLAIQPLDELYEDLNLFQITPDEEQELELIKGGYGVADPAHALWKVLLARKLSESDESVILYEELATLFGEKDFVQFGYFKDHWLDANSELLIPRRRKHFRLLCNFLGLEPAYYRLKLKKRSSLRSNSRQSNAQMNSLLSQMIEEGLFEPGVDWRNRPLQHLLELHELEEKGMTEDNLNVELEVLVHLLQDKIRFRRVQKIEKS